MYTCIVCNYDCLEEELYDEDGGGSFEICPCCGFQYGLHDYNEIGDKEITYINWRAKWIKNGCKWHDKSMKPPVNWSAKEQLENKK